MAKNEKIEYAINFKITGIEELEKYKELIKEFNGESKIDLFRSLKINDEGDIKKLQALLESINEISSSRNGIFDSGANIILKELDRLANEIKEKIYFEFEDKGDMFLMRDTARKNSQNREVDLSKVAKSFVNQLKISEEIPIQSQEYLEDPDIDMSSKKNQVEEKVLDKASDFFFDKIKKWSKNKFNVDDGSNKFFEEYEKYEEGFEKIQEYAELAENDAPFLEKLIDYFVGKNKYTREGEYIVNLLHLIGEALREIDHYKSPFDDNTNDSYHEFLDYNDNFIKNTEDYIKSIPGVEQEAQEELIQLMRKQLALKAQFYIEDTKLREKYHINQDFKISTQILDGRFYENDWYQFKQYLDARNELEERYGRNIDRNNIKIKEQNNEIDKLIAKQYDLNKIAEKRVSQGTPKLPKLDVTQPQDAIQNQNKTAPILNTNLPSVDTKNSDVGTPKIENKTKPKIKQPKNIIGSGSDGYKVQFTIGSDVNFEKLQEENRKLDQKNVDSLKDNLSKDHKEFMDKITDPQYIKDQNNEAIRELSADRKKDVSGITKKQEEGNQILKGLAENNGLKFAPTPAPSVEKSTFIEPKAFVPYKGISPNYLVAPTPVNTSSTKENSTQAEAVTPTPSINTVNSIIEVPEIKPLVANSFSKSTEEQIEKAQNSIKSLQETIKQTSEEKKEIVKAETKTIEDETEKQTNAQTKLKETHKSTSEVIQEIVTDTLNAFKGQNKGWDVVIDFTTKNLSKIRNLFKKNNEETKDDNKKSAEETNKITKESAEKDKTTVEEVALKNKETAEETTKAIQETIKQSSEERKEIAKDETENLETEKEKRVGVLSQLAKAYIDNTGGAKEAISGLLTSLKGDNKLVNGLLDVADKGLPKLLGLFVKTNSNINKNVEESTEERNKTLADGMAKTEEITQTSLEKIQEHVQVVTEVISMVFEAINASLQEKVEEAEEEYKVISAKYDEVADKVAESNSRIKSLNEDAKNAQGGRLIVIQEQISREIEANKELADQQKQLAKDKEKAEQDKEKLEKKIKKNELKMQLIQSIGNIATGVAKALSMGPILGPIMAAVVTAAGAIQIATINKQISKLADGGLLNGKTHAQGGMRVEGTNIEVEGGEYVINRASTRKNLGLVSYINSQRRELTPKDIDGYFKSSGSYAESPNFKTMFAQGGQLPAEAVTNTYEVDPMIGALESINMQPVVSVVDIANVQKNLTRVTDWTNTSSF